MEELLLTLNPGFLPHTWHTAKVDFQTFLYYSAGKKTKKFITHKQNQLILYFLYFVEQNTSFSAVPYPPTHPLTCFAFVILNITHAHKPKTKHVHNQHLQLNSQKHFSALPSGVHTPQTTHTVFQRLSHTQLSFRYMYAILLHTSCPHNDRHTHNLSPLHLLHHKTHTYCTGVWIPVKNSSHSNKTSPVGNGFCCKRNCSFSNPWK